MNWYFILAKRSTTFKEPVKDGDKKNTGADDLPQGHRSKENPHLPEEISQEIICFRCQQAVFDHRPLNFMYTALLPFATPSGLSA